MNTLPRLEKVINPHLHSAENNILTQIRKSGNYYEILSFYFDFYYNGFEFFNDIEREEIYSIFKGYMAQFRARSDEDLLEYMENQPETWKKRVELKYQFDRYIRAKEPKQILLRTLLSTDIINIRALEKKTGLSRNTLSGFVNRSRGINRDNAKKVLRYLAQLGLRTY